MLKSRRIRFESLEERNLLTVAAGTSLAASLPEPQPTGANTWIVTTLADTVNASDNYLSLREAVDMASNGDLITFSSSLRGGTIHLNGKQIKITSAITISGRDLASSGVNGITISANGMSRIFYTASSSGIISIDYVNFTNGNAGDGGEGSGIYNTGELLIDHCTLSSCRATGKSYGGAMRNKGGTVTIANSSFTGNSSYLGAGVSNKVGTVTINNCTFTGNSTAANGGALYNEGTLLITGTVITGNKAVSGGAIRNFGNMTISNSRVTGNSASDLGGGIWSSGMTVTRNCTIAGNSAYQGGGIYHDASESGTLVLYNTIVYSNTQSNAASLAGSRDIFGTATGSNNLSSKTISGNDNIVYSSSSSALFVKPTSGDYTLADGSAAIDAGNNAYAVSATAGTLVYDLAGNARIVNGIVDIGAYESQSKPSFNLSVTGYSGVYDAMAHTVALNGALATDTVYYSVDGVSYTLSAPPTYTNVGSNTVFVKVERSGYTPWTGSASVTITARPFSVIGTTVSDKAYDGTTAATVNIGTVSGLIQGDAVIVSVSGAFPNSAPGTYNVPVSYTISGTNSSNYAVPASTLCSATIFDATTSKVSVSVVVSTAPPTVSELSVLPGSITSTDGGSTVYVQVWVKNNDGSTLGITGGYVDVNYTYPQLTYNSFNPGSIFINTTNLVDSSSVGRLSLFGGCPNAEATSVGVSNWALLGYAAFNASNSGTVTVAAAPPTLNGVANQGLNLTRLTHGTLNTAEIDYSSVTFTVTNSLPALTTPTITSVSSYGANRHQVVWESVPNAVQYQLDWSTDQTNWNSATTAGTNYVVTGLTYGSLVYYRVRAIGNGTTYGNSAWSSTSSLRVCPMDIDSDGFIGSGDYSLLSARWLDTSTSSSWDPRCDVDGDGLIGPGDWSFLMSNWFKYSTATPLYYPPARAALPFESLDAVFAAEEFFADLF
ncbi:MAG: hypothetical protein K6E55_10490 [Thermoguttaceae bacterium]|nr:hypothetical protein [Thermoguttaceae bacterium]